MLTIGSVAATRFPELTPQFADFFKALCRVPENGCRSNQLSYLGVQQDDCEFDRNAPSVLGQSRHRQKVALAVMAFAGCHYLSVSRPMACSEIFQNDQIEGATDSLL